MFFTRGPPGVLKDAIEAALGPYGDVCASPHWFCSFSVLISNSGHVLLTPGVKKDTIEADMGPCGDVRHFFGLSPCPALTFNAKKQLSRCCAGAVKGLAQYTVLRFYPFQDALWQRDTLSG